MGLTADARGESHEPIPEEDASDLDPHSKGWPQVLDLHVTYDSA